MVVVAALRAAVSHKHLLFLSCSLWRVCHPPKNSCQQECCRQRQSRSGGGGAKAWEDWNVLQKSPFRWRRGCAGWAPRMGNLCTNNRPTHVESSPGCYGLCPYWLSTHCQPESRAAEQDRYIYCLFYHLCIGLGMLWVSCPWSVHVWVLFVSNLVQWTVRVACSCSARALCCRSLSRLCAAFSVSLLQVAWACKHCFLSEELALAFAFAMQRFP